MSITLEHFNLKQLKIIAKDYRHITLLKGVSKMSKPELIQELQKHIYMSDNAIHIKEHNQIISRPTDSIKYRKNILKKVESPIKKLQEQFKNNLKRKDDNMLHLHTIFTELSAFDKRKNSLQTEIENTRLTASGRLKVAHLKELIDECIVGMKNKKNELKHFERLYGVEYAPDKAKKILSRQQIREHNDYFNNVEEL